MKPITEEQLQKAISHFFEKKDFPDYKIFGNGHINDTYLLDLNGEKFTFQRINTDVFTRPVEVMENIENVTSHLRKKILENGGDTNRETLNFLSGSDGNTYYSDEYGSFWRCYKYINDVTCYNHAERPEDFYESAVSFGTFQRLLSDFPAETLHETIPDFHNTKARFKTFLDVVSKDSFGRVLSAKKEIEFVYAHEDLANTFGNLTDRGEIPLRVTHNDTKLNNILFDNKTNRGICIIDLDTVMPGLAMNDFGDSIRFGASTAAEDERDLSKVSCDMNLFESYTNGFIKGCGSGLTDSEIELLPMGAKVMTFECGMRFLTDYLQGDTYFKIHRDGHNLDRCRTQFKLLADMKSKWNEMQGIVKKYRGKI